MWFGGISVRGSYNYFVLFWKNAAVEFLSPSKFLLSHSPGQMTAIIKLRRRPIRRSEWHDGHCIFNNLAGSVFYGYVDITHTYLAVSAVLTRCDVRPHISPGVGKQGVREPTNGSGPTPPKISTYCSSRLVIDRLDKQRAAALSPLIYVLPMRLPLPSNFFS